MAAHSLAGWPPVSDHSEIIQELADIVAEDGDEATAALLYAVAVAQMAGASSLLLDYVRPFMRRMHELMAQAKARWN